MGILQLLASRNFITVNKTLIQTLGIEEAIMLGELASEYDYWKSNGELEEGWFFSTVENVEENTTLTKYKQKKALDNLQKIGVLEVQRKGIPAKRYIKINEERVFEILSNKKSKNLTSGSQEILLLEVKKFDRNNNNNNNNNNNISLKKEIYKERNEEKCESENEINKDSNLPCTENSDTEKTVHVNSDNKAGNNCKNCANNGNSKNSKRVTTNNKVGSKTLDPLIQSYTNNEEMQELLAEFIEIRAKMKKPLTPNSLKRNLKVLDRASLENGGNGTDEEKIKIIERTVINSWQSFYSLKSNVYSKPRKLFDKPSYDLEAYEKFYGITEFGKSKNKDVFGNDDFMTLDELERKVQEERNKKFVDINISEDDFTDD